MLDPDLIARLRARAATRRKMLPHDEHAWRWAFDGNRIFNEGDPWLYTVVTGTAHDANLVLDLEAAADALAHACETCRHRWPREDKADLCGQASIYGHTVAQVSCQRLGYGCRAWEAK